MKQTMKHAPSFLGLSLRAAPFALALGVLQSADAQTISFSIDNASATVGTPDCAGFPITEGDILFPATGTGIPAFGPLPAPCILMPGGAGGLGLFSYAGCVGHAGGTLCPIEVDALSYGVDHPVQPINDLAGTYVFSVDECSTSFPGSPRPPAIWTEVPFGDSAADVWNDGGLPAPPLPPAAGGPGHVGYVDGDGLPSPSGFVYPGLGLLEPDFPGAIDGDDLDAVDFDTFTAPTPVFPVYFSLDSQRINFCTGGPKTNSAGANGFMPGDIVMTPFAGAAPALYAPAPALGLDQFGPATDDLDALALWENGVPGYQPSANPYDWLIAGGPADMVLFSVCASSSVVGMPDSLFGAPIEPGDILMPPVAGGVSPFPAIFVAAEWIGLSTTRFGNLGDNLDALDTRRCPEPGRGYCFGDGSGTACPCGNFGAPGNGCEHSFGLGGGNLTGTGKPSVSSDSLVLTVSNLPPSTICLLFQAATPDPFGTVFGDGLLCTSGPVIRLGAKATVGGTASWGVPPISVLGGVPAVGGIRQYQGWYRNQAPAFCTPARVNLTNGYEVTWVP